MFFLDFNVSMPTLIPHENYNLTARINTCMCVISIVIFFLLYFKGGAAVKAGVQEGDRIIKVLTFFTSKM